MNQIELVEQIRLKKSFLCVGLDTDLQKLPGHLPKTPEGALAFNKAIIDETHGVAVSYKINTAFYESMGQEGWAVMEKTVQYIPDGIFTIADAKRGDIGNTSSQYARAFFETLNFDSITVAPYMGRDSVGPFLEHKDKTTIVLGLTSNRGSQDFQYLPVDEGLLFEKVISEIATWGEQDQLMFVVGATQTEQIQKIRTLIPHHFLLVPGVGAQGGSLEDVYRYGANEQLGLLVNSSRGIIYADSSETFAKTAGTKAKQLQQEMAALMA